MTSLKTDGGWPLLKTVRVFAVSVLSIVVTSQVSHEVGEKVDRILTFWAKGKTEAAVKGLLVPKCLSGLRQWSNVHLIINPDSSDAVRDGKKSCCFAIGQVTFNQLRDLVVPQTPLNRRGQILPKMPNSDEVKIPEK